MTCWQVRSVALGILSRRINWQLLSVMETVESKYTYFSYSFFFLPILYLQQNFNVVLSNKILE